MDFSSWQTWVFVVIGALVVFGIIGAVGGRGKSPTSNIGPDPGSEDRLAVQTSSIAALSAYASKFDREMYVDDMTETQLEDEHVWRTAFIACHTITDPCSVSEKHPASRIATAITGKPFDPQLFGLTEYYLETAYEAMMAAGEDRYWDDELIAMKDHWSPEKREQILLAALVPLARARDIHLAARQCEPGPDNTGARLSPFIDRVGEAFFGPSATEKMAALRAQATSMANQIAL